MKMQRCAELAPVDGATRFLRIARVADIPASMGRPTGWYAVDPAVSPSAHYWDAETQAPVAYPPSPGEGWRFDFAAQAYVPDEAALWARARARRDELLRACDWRVLPDAPTPEEERAAWLAYRQALRDITLQADPAAIVWPVPPG